jgi:hypothetical protein
LNVSAGKIDTMSMNYFSDSLLDQTVLASLDPYVAQKAG